MSVEKQLLLKISNKSLEVELASLNTIGERLKFLRKKHLKLSRADLSARIGIEVNMLNKYENGYFQPKADRIKQFAEFYCIPIEYITGESFHSMIKEDYFLISNLHMYCWEIDHELTAVDNLHELNIALSNAANIVIQALEQLDTKEHDYMYLSSLSTNSSPISLHSISSILYFGILVRDALSKKEYREVINYLEPLINSYKTYIKSSFGNEKEMNLVN